MSLRTVVQGRPDASVIIPTYNAGDGFERLLEAISAQRSDFTYEVLVVDSGSSDGTPDVARRHSARVLPIAKSEFSHGGTQNRGISEACGEKVAGVCSRQIPRFIDHYLSRGV